MIKNVRRIEMLLSLAKSTTGKFAPDVERKQKKKNHSEIELSWKRRTRMGFFFFSQSLRVAYYEIMEKFVSNKHET
jgi:hypothetical protein